MNLDLVIVDDSTLWLSISKKLGEQHPLVRSVTTFKDTLDAWVYIQTHKPNAILTDVEMPGFDGLSFLCMFATRMPIIASSTKQGFTAHTRELGGTGFLSKPFAKKQFDLMIFRVHKALYPREYILKKEVAIAV